MCTIHIHIYTEFQNVQKVDYAKYLTWFYVEIC